MTALFELPPAPLYIFVHISTNRKLRQSNKEIETEIRRWKIKKKMKKIKKKTDGERKLFLFTINPLAETIEPWLEKKKCSVCRGC